MSIKRIKGRTPKYGQPLTEKVQVLFTADQAKELREKVGVGDVGNYIRERAIADNIYPSGSDTTGLTPVKVIGSIPAGAPRATEEYENQELICSWHPSGPEYAYVHVAGDSMDKIVPSGAYALVKKKWALSGEIIAAAITMSDGAVDVTLKKLLVGANNEITLEPCSHNDKHRPIKLSETKPKGSVEWVKPECAEIVGVFTGDYVVAAGK